ncbi:MAG: Glycosyltransferase family 25 (LPS biosynthesis protein) [Bacteroidetes bacterium ADurb.Bin408]|nr:MAG: Glycosyltransferase family 25 (LPS biosynthesis protein) [Bacteroidetes bacterium ADurb.Bin408]
MGMDMNDVTIEQLRKEGVYDESNAFKYYPYDESAPMSIGHIACSWGQREIYKTIVGKEFKKALVFEDDLTVNPYALEHIPDMLAHIPPDADLIYWGYEMNVKPRWYSFAERWYAHLMLTLLKLKGKRGFFLHTFPVTTHQNINKIYCRPYNKYFMVAGAHYCTHAFSINDKCAGILRDIQTPVCLPADLLLNMAIMHGHIKAYIATPMLFIQDKHNEKSKLPNYIVQ